MADQQSNGNTVHKVCEDYNDLVAKCKKIRNKIKKMHLVSLDFNNQISKNGPETEEEKEFLSGFVADIKSVIYDILDIVEPSDEVDRGSIKTEKSITSISNGNGFTDDEIKEFIADDDYKPEYPKIPRDKPLSVTISHVNGPCDFYLQPYSGASSFVMESQKAQVDLAHKGIY